MQQSGRLTQILEELHTERLRPGQRDALRVILQRIAEDEAYTAIVLPTRYGKSDVIRLGGLVLARAGVLALAFALSPNTYLRSQLVAQEKVAAMVARYGMPATWEGYGMGELTQGPSDLLPLRWAAKGEFLLSVTTQLVCGKVPIFRAKIQQLRNEVGGRVVLFVDECHLGISHDLPWGDAVAELVAVGAQVVLLTATAERADGKPIRGFDLETVRVEPVRVVKVRPGSTPETVYVEIHEGQRSILALQAHHTTTFRQAWAERDVLCQISCVTLDINLEELQLPGTAAAVRLSDIRDEQEARRVLALLVRDRRVIRAGVERLAEKLKVARASEPTARAIVFCGNDLPDDRDDNAHARRIKEALDKQGLTCLIVTSSIADGAQTGGTEKLRAFAQTGSIDVLICKQMAAIGLDDPTLKVALDLSAIRTLAAYVQRIMRIATPLGCLGVACLITPEDCLADALFKRVVRDQGGEARVSDLELVGMSEEERQAERDRRRRYMVIGPEDGEMRDSEGREADRIHSAAVRSLLESFPFVAQRATDARLADWVKQWVRTDLELLSPRIANTEIELELLREAINQEADLCVQALGRRAAYRTRNFGEIRAEVFTEVYRLCGVPRGVELSQIRDLELMRQVAGAMHRRLGELIRDEMGGSR
jgi:superfamily II DNA or RNA helicase